MIEQIVAWSIISVALLMILYIYIGYPLLILLLSRLFPRPVRQADITPMVSIIIAAHNEERDIEDKILNTLSLEYPVSKLEIIVASDCSMDRTDEIVRSFADRGVILHRCETRFGKNMAQFTAATGARGDILLFSDATTMYEPDVIEKIVRNFADPEVGCVSGQLIYVDKSSSAVGTGCRSYWGYEKFIKDSESRLGSLIGVSGCLYAVRRSSQMRLAPDMIDDFVIATEIHLQGLRTIYEPEAVSVEDTNHKSKNEWAMRVRVIEQTINALSRYSIVLNPFTHGFFALQMFCHKLLRYTVPLWLAIIFIASAVSFSWSPLFMYLFLAQTAFYLVSALGYFLDKANMGGGVITIPYYFCLLNAAVCAAFIKFFNGDNHVLWDPVRDTQQEKLRIES